MDNFTDRKLLFNKFNSVLVTNRIMKVCKIRKTQTQTMVTKLRMISKVVIRMYSIIKVALPP